MNLSKLFEMQKELDDYIVKTKGLEGQDFLPQKILALQVELGECANEWRGFKFWSENQKPKGKKEIKCDCCDGIGVIDDEPCRTCVGGIVGYENKLLEEYVDCLHFILSIGLELDFEWLSYVHENNIECFKNSKGITRQFTDVFYAISMFSNDYEDQEVYEDMFCSFNSLGSMLGFSWEQIEQAYTDKWNVNKQRQENGY